MGTSDPINPSYGINTVTQVRLQVFHLSNPKKIKMQSLIQVNKRLENEGLITRLTQISDSSPASLKDRYMVNAARLRLQLCGMQSALEEQSRAWAYTPEFVPRSNSMSSSDTGNGLNVSAKPFVMASTDSSCSDSESDAGTPLSGIESEVRRVLSRGIESTSSKRRKKKRRARTQNYRNNRS